MKTIFLFFPFILFCNLMNSQNTEELYLVNPTELNQKFNKIFAPYNKSQLTIFDNEGNHLTGKLVNVSDRIIVLNIPGESMYNAFQLENISKIKFKRGWGYMGGAGIALIAGTGLSSLVLLEQNDGWQVLGFYILMMTVVPAVTFISGGVSAILSENIIIKTDSPNFMKKINKLKNFAQDKSTDMNTGNFIMSGFYNQGN